ncbi:MAG: hypothetical protein KGK11_08435 [Sphingomonadales bacterium]|nr:hypothetical protein [Sphingomonadales bacterium]
MLPRHLHSLMSKLEDVVDLGCSIVRKEELKRWFNCLRFSKANWRTIHEYWESIEEDVPLLVGEGDGIFTFAYGRGLVAGEDPWFIDIREKAGMTLNDDSSEGDEES